MNTPLIYFVGTSFAADHLRKAARDKGFEIARSLRDAHLVFVSEDTPTDKDGKRDLDHIHAKIMDTLVKMGNPVLVITSQVPPGFTRSLGFTIPLYHQAE